MGYTALIPITIICVLANHMGLISTIEKILDKELLIVNCCRCSTFWFSVIYLTVTGHNLIVAAAVSFVAAYLAMWLELLFGIIDRQYDNIYEKFFTNNTEDNSRAENQSSAENGMP